VLVLVAVPPPASRTDTVTVNVPLVWYAWLPVTVNGLSLPFTAPTELEPSPQSMVTV
jgi:hypothetical protein